MSDLLSDLLVHFQGFAFLKIGITLKSFKGSEKIPVTKGWLVRVEIGIVIALENFLRSFFGILYGPTDFLRFNVLIMSPTS